MEQFTLLLDAFHLDRQQEIAMKTLIDIIDAPAKHWVGNGFPVHGMFNYNGPNVPQRSPFLLLDYAAPTRFEPTNERRGVGQHPHRGFETVTIVYAGEVEHRDSTGNGGVIGPGDVQWMTAGAGILHEEFHSRAYATHGGPFEMVQLWVNLPAKHKMSPANYQGIVDASIPAVQLPDEAGRVRVIAGAHAGHAGPAHSFTPMNVLDVSLLAGKSAELPQPEGWTTLVVMLEGEVLLNGASLRAKQVATLSTTGSRLHIAARSDSKCLILAGEPIDEPVVGHGPFVMNSQQEIIQAIADYNRGAFGRMPQ